MVVRVSQLPVVAAVDFADSLPVLITIIQCFSVLFSEEIVDDPFSLDADVIYGSLNELEKLEKVTQSDQCFIRYIDCVIVLLNARKIYDYSKEFYTKINVQLFIFL